MIGLAKKTVIGSLIVTAGLLTACGNKGANGKYASKQVLNWYGSDLTSVDLSKVTDLASFSILNNSQEGLYRLGTHDKVQNGLATKTQISDNGKQYTFDLRHGVKWSNGETVTAKDFVYSWERTLDPKTTSQYGYLFSGIKNADAISNGKKKPSTLGIQANGKYQLKVTLEKKIPYFKLLMGFPVFFPANQTAVEKYGKQYGTKSSKMVYDGPFKLTGWNGTSGSYRLIKNQTYWDHKNVHLSAINFNDIKDQSTGLNLYNSGKLDGTQLNGTEAKNMAHNKNLVTRQQASSYYLAYNQKMKLFKNADVRKAFSMAIDRKMLTQKVLGDGSFDSQSFVSSKLANNPKTGQDFAAEAAKPAVMQYNPKAAKAAWTKAKKSLGKTKVTVTLMNADDFTAKSVSEYLQATLQKNLPGLTVQLKNIPGKTKLAREASHNFQISLCNWFADFSDPITFLNILTTNNPSNNGLYSNASYDRLIDRSNNADGLKPSVRWQDMLQAQKIVLSEQGITPLYQSADKWLIKGDVKGVIYNSAGVNYNFKDAYIAK